MMKKDDEKIKGGVCMIRELTPEIKSKPSREGFTLIEVVIALFCFTVATLAISSLSTDTWKSVSISKSSTEASVMASKVLESLISRNYQDEAIEDVGGPHTFEEDGYTITYYINDEAVLPDTKCVQMNVMYDLGDSTKSVRMYYLLPEIIR
jgi:Tfp pilus assembly protein PilV